MKKNAAFIFFTFAILASCSHKDAGVLSCVSSAIEAISHDVTKVSDFSLNDMVEENIKSSLVLLGKDYELIHRDSNFSIYDIRIDSSSGASFFVEVQYYVDVNRCVFASWDREK